MAEVVQLEVVGQLAVVGQLVVVVVVVPKPAEVQVLQEGPGFQSFRVVQVVPLFVQFFQRFVKRRLRKGMCVESNKLNTFQLARSYVTPYTN